jgi:tetratricopeptide (TPR) repeat protein
MPHLPSTRSLPIAFAIFGLVLGILATISLEAQTADATSSLHGTIRDSQGNPLPNASIQLSGTESKEAPKVYSDAQGHYAFTQVHPGVYTLHAELAGCGEATISSIFVAAKKDKIVDLSLAPEKTPTHEASPGAPQFFDQPTFTVSGVTDTTSLGGHGSDSLVRTRENVAKDAASLKSPPTAASPAEATHDPLHAAQAYLAAGDYQHAREAAEALLAHNENDAALHHLLGDVDENLADPLNAVHEYQRAAELDPTEPYWFDWGSELLLHHAPEPALEVFGEGHRRFPNSARMLVGMGTAWFARGSNDQASHLVCQAADLNPADPTPYLFLGEMLAAISAPSDEMMDRLRRFATLNPQNAQANYYYAAALWKQRKLDPAALAAQEKSLLGKSVQLDPAFSGAHLQLGIVYSEQKDFAQAIAEYQSAIKAAPQMEEAHYRLAQAYRATGNPDRAKAEVQTYEQLTKKSAETEERERREIRQFVYTLRDQPAAQKP